MIEVPARHDPEEREAAAAGDVVMQSSTPPDPPDLRSVRIHTGPAAEASAKALHARAYTVGFDIVFGEGEFAPDTREGIGLIEHELTHVAQQAESGVPMLQRAGGPLDQRLDDEFAEWRQAIDDFEGANQMADAAYSRRIVLMLQGVDGDSFADEGALETFLDDVERDALSEEVTLARTGDWALRMTKAFPMTWSDRVYDALYLEVDTEALQADRADKQDAMEAAGDRVPPGVMALGLPVPHAESRSLSEFHLLFRHTRLNREHAIKDLAIAVRDYSAAGWQAGFYLLWNGMAENFADRVFAGEIAVNFDDYTEFVDARRQGMLALGERIRAVDTEALMASFDDDVVSLTNVAFISAVASALIGLVPAMFLWREGDELFDEKLLETDGLVGGQAWDDLIRLALVWAWENDFFSDAGAELINGILSHGWEILAMVAAFIVVQYIPYLNVAVDVVVVAYSGIDALRALNSLYGAFSTVAAADSAVSLQRAAAQMVSSLEGDTLRLLLDLLAIGAATGSIGARASALRGAGLSEEEALRQALREATGEEAAALRNALARRRISASLDTEGVLEGVLDMGVSAEAVEQALMSGMSPQRLNSIVAGITDASRAETLITYAGNYSSPLNALLDAGLPVSRIGGVADLALGLRQLRACEILIQRTGQAADVEGLIGALGQFGSNGASQFIRLTPEGLASVYQAGGAGSMQLVLDTLALADTGQIVGFGDWVEFTISRMNKQGGDLLNAMGELREAQRVAETLGPGETVRIGGDLRGATDVAVEQAGAATRSIEVTTATGRLEGFADLTQGIRHGIENARSVTSGTAEVTIRTSIRPRASMGRGRVRVMEPDGTFQIVEANGNVYRRGDVLQDTAANLPSITDSNLLSRVTVVNMDGTTIGTINRVNGVWVVTR